MKKSKEKFVAVDGKLLDTSSNGYRKLYMKWCAKFIQEEDDVVHKAGVTPDVRNSITKKCKAEIPLEELKLKEHKVDQKLATYASAKAKWDSIPPAERAARSAAADKKVADELARTKVEKKATEDAAEADLKAKGLVVAAAKAVEMAKATAKAVNDKLIKNEVAAKIAVDASEKKAADDRVAATTKAEQDAEAETKKKAAEREASAQAAIDGAKADKPARKREKKLVSEFEDTEMAIYAE